MNPVDLHGKQSCVKQVVQTLFAYWPMSGRACWHGRRTSGKVALTFDDGPDAVFTPQVLEILKREQVLATFFVSGICAERNPDLLERIIEDGHEIGLHGYDHTPSDIAGQMMRCAAILEKVGGTPRLCRLPGGYKYPLAAFVAIVIRGYRIVFWSFDAHDSMRHDGKWKGPAPDYGVIQGWDIVLLHDDNPVCVSELPGLIKSLKARGLDPVSVSEML